MVETHGEYEKGEADQEFSVRDLAAKLAGAQEGAPEFNPEPEVSPDRYIGIKPGFFTISSDKVPLETYKGHEGTFVISAHENPDHRIVTIVNPDGNANIAANTDYTFDELRKGGYKPGADMPNVDLDGLRAVGN